MNLRKDHYRCVEKCPGTVRCFAERFACPGRRAPPRGPKRRDWLRFIGGKSSVAGRRDRCLSRVEERSHGCWWKPRSSPLPKTLRVRLVRMTREKPVCVDAQLRTMDHLARIAMKNAANCVKYGEMQGYRNRNMSNAYCGPGIDLSGPHLSEGLLNAMSISLLCDNRRREASIGIHRVVGASCVVNVSASTNLKTPYVSGRRSHSLSSERVTSCRPPSEVRNRFLMSCLCGETCTKRRSILWTSDQVRLPAKFKHII